MLSSVLSLSYAAWAHPSGEWISDNNEVYFGRDGSGNHYYSKFAFKTPKVMGKSQKLTLSLTTSQQSNPTPNVAYLSQEDLQADQLSGISSYIAQAASNHTANTNVSAGTAVEFVFDTDAKKIIKQLKLPKDTDLVELGKSIIQSATSGADTGPIGFDEDDLAYNNGKALEDCHYYHLANDQYEVWFNSASMRIYKIKKVK